MKNEEKDIAAETLEFPDWTGIKPHSIRLSPAEAFRWNEEMLSLFPVPGKSRRDSRSRCEVEFKL
jgi:hypothetical protein